MDAWKRLALENKTLSCSTLWLQLIWCDENKWICQISNGVDSVYERESTRSARIVRCVVDADIGCFYCAHGRGTATTYFLVGDPMYILDIHQTLHILRTIPLQTRSLTLYASHAMRQCQLRYFLSPRPIWLEPWKFWYSMLADTLGKLIHRVGRHLRQLIHRVGRQL